MRRAHLVRQLVGQRADVVAARLRVGEGVLDGGADRGLGRVHDVRLEIAPRENPGERNGEAGLALPPLAEVGNRDEPVLAVREAALVDDQAGVHLARDDGGKDPVVPELEHLAERRRREPEKQEGRRLPTRNGDTPRRRLLESACLPRDHQRADATAERGSAPQQPVPLARGRRRAEAQLRELQLAAGRSPVQVLDVAQNRFHLERRANESVHERVERERVVRAGREAEAQLHERPKNQASSGLSSSLRVNGRTRSAWPSRSETVKSSSSVSFASWSASPSS